MSECEPSSTVQNQHRRTLLTLGITGVVTFLLGKLVGEAGGDFFARPSLLSGKKTEFSNFTLEESEGEILLSDKTGEPIFIVDKTSFKQ